MKKLTVSLLIISLLLLSLPVLAAEKELTAREITEKVDLLLNAPKDQSLQIKMILTDRNGAEEVREMIMLQKGDDKRMGEFLSPADQKGIAFLSLPNDTFYLYLPAFKKTRRIASHLKNSRFAGTDFTYENLEAKRYSQDWKPKLLKKEGGYYLLELTPDPGAETEYSKLLLQVRTDDFYPTRIEFHGKSGHLKTLTNSKIEKINGYLIAREMEMLDIQSGRRTKMIITEAKFDTGLTDDRFSERYLKR